MKNLFQKIALTLFFIPIICSAAPSDKSIHALNVLNNWNNTMSQQGFITHDMKFEKEFIEFSDTNTWFNIDYALDEEDRFYKIASDADGANYYLWFYPELKGEPPVVVITLSDGSADNVTDNMKDFSCSFILGETLSGDSIYNRSFDNISSIKDQKSKMLNALDCPKKVNVFWGFSGEHPNFNDWLDELDTKYQN